MNYIAADADRARGKEKAGVAQSGRREGQVGRHKVDMSVILFVTCVLSLDGVFGAANPSSSRHHNTRRFVTNGINLTDTDDVVKRFTVPERSNETASAVSTTDNIHAGAVIGIARKRWPLKVPYTTAELTSPDGNRVVRDSIRDIEKKTCLTFVRRTIEVDYINFMDGEGCFSQIGKQGGKQDVILGEGCFTQPKTEHEIMHTLGSYHEMNRPDRDKYVKIFFKNIQPKFREQFIRRTKPAPETKYDYGSIMHYGKWAFSRNGKPIMFPKLVNGRRYIGDFGVLDKHKGMTPRDAQALNHYYACDRVNSKILVDFEVRPKTPQPAAG